MTDMEQVATLDEMGIEFCGFIFYPKSPRYVFSHLPANAIKRYKGRINKVGVFVNEDPQIILETVDNCGLYLVQLHGDESPKDCERISNYITTVKAFRLSDDANILWTIREYQDVVDMFMFDTEGVGYGGTGKKFNWNVLSGLTINKPFFLSGGIDPSDADNLKAFMKDPVSKDLFAIDINSRFELFPGRKDLNKIQKFVEEMEDPYL